ncbi:ZIP family metal transporter [Aliiroseovarius sp. PTFE2010]|uniref:ZIP family metal transporter n=1 Tax=Aliiroseovarius sp. PTFE2010 TaxID=3417190 RepID=UPI003CF8D591
MTLIVLAIVAAALLIGAAWGIFAPLSEETEGFVIAVAGGALIVSIMSELVEPASHHLTFLSLAAALVFGASLFVLLDRFVKRKIGAQSGGGLLVSVTLDGIPENLALGVALIGAGPKEVAALAGSIFLSNLPEAAGGAKGMQADGSSKPTVLAIWAGTAVLLTAAALIGNLMLAGVSEAALAAVRVTAAGVVAASLATEIFPKAYNEDSMSAGIAVALGLAAAHGLSQLGG